MDLLYTFGESGHAKDIERWHEKERVLCKVRRISVATRLWFYWILFVLNI